MAVSVKAPGWVEEFRNFIMKGNVVDLAVAVVIGAAFTTIVNSLVKDLLNPVIGLLVGGIDFTNVFVTLRGKAMPTLEAAKAAGAVTMNFGLFINAVIQFVIVAFAIFWLLKVLTRMHPPAPAPAAAPPGPKAEDILIEIRDLLAKQAH